MKNHESQYLRGKESMLKVLELERRPARQIGERWDAVLGIMVKIYAGPADTPFRTIPTGYE